MKDISLIVGLGNPGIQYVNTKHNVGFEVIDRLVDVFDVPIVRNKFDGELYEKDLPNKKIILVKPMTFMNLSGNCVHQIFAWYKLRMNQVLVVYDDVDVELGKIKIKPKGSAGTHNGMKSIIARLKGQDFPRVRIGIGRPQPDRTLTEYVLQRFSKSERVIVDESVLMAEAAVVDIVHRGLDYVMNQYNR